MKYRRYQRYSYREKPKDSTNGGRGKEVKGNNEAKDTTEIRIM